MKLGEKVKIQGKDHLWSLEASLGYFLIGKRDGMDYNHDDSTVKEFFDDLGIANHREFLEKTYGGRPISGIWPEWDGDSEEMSDKVIKAINEFLEAPKPCQVPYEIPHELSTEAPDFEDSKVNEDLLLLL